MISEALIHALVLLTHTFQFWFQQGPKPMFKNDIHSECGSHIQ